MTDDEPSAAYLNEGFVVAISIEAKEGEGDAVGKILEQLVAPTMAETGVMFFVPYRSPSNPLSFFVYERYHDEAAWDAHNHSGHFQSAIKELLPRVAKRQRVPFVPYVCD